MKGLEISRSFYEKYGKAMLEEQFADVLPYLAVGLVGSGSEKYGFDDEISRDHDFEAGFAIFLPEEEIIDRKTEFRLERAYSKLPKEYEGIIRQTLSPVGGNRNGPIRIDDFYLSKVGSPNGELSIQNWLTIPDYALAEATNGEVFYDGLGKFTLVREKLKNMPKDIMKKRIAGNLLNMAQSGQYNFARVCQRSEYEAAQFCCDEYVSSCIKILFLLKGKYAPYYKWSFRALKEIEEDDICRKLSTILLQKVGKESAHDIYLAIEDVAGMIIERLKKANLTEAVCADLEKHAYSVNDSIEDGNVRNLNIMISL